VRLIETHISWVLLGAREANKIKKPVRLPFLDFTALDDRRRFCEEELRLNRRLAPELYLEVVAVRDGPAGPSLDGPGAVVDFAVRMRRFPRRRALERTSRRRTLRAADVDAFARRLADFHRDAARGNDRARLRRIRTQERVTGRLVAGVDAWQAALARPGSGWPGLRQWLEEERRRLEDHWTARLSSGRVRECHGDLHLANIVQPGEEATRVRRDRVRPGVALDRRA
jgi:aminoglycoside phosphotransferase family enzyme